MPLPQSRATASATAACTLALTTSQESRFRRLCSLTSIGTQSRHPSGINCSAAPCPATRRRGPRSSGRMYAWMEIGAGLGCRRRHRRKRRCRCSRIWPPVPGAGRRKRFFQLIFSFTPLQAELLQLYSPRLSLKAPGTTPQSCNIVEASRLYNFLFVVVRGCNVYCGGLPLLAAPAGAESSNGLVAKMRQRKTRAR